ncbi:ABC transporter permease [Pseudoflavonifractor sp. MSJ-37]|uniref:ABC transporter permease n=1 Tax=Pseudoflavonifractor sp. MSJ-37 TaxID=2841531 RepID=UPI001C105F9E|nr:ABC transporter permease [Pseudoflavonifractor sp. MSJ-37]MBU5436049.1 ABC transporter permease [Pseudoflavonifractor sp. MSJ-37]
MADKQKKPVIGSLQPDVDAMLDWDRLTPDDFAPAEPEEKENFIQARRSVSYWSDAWRRLRKNGVAMVALGVIVLLVLFAFVGPMLVPYGYDERNIGAENLFPYHYTLEEQAQYQEAASAADPETAVANARAEAEAKGETLTRKEEALIRAKAKSGGEYAGMSEAEVYAALGIHKHAFGYSNKELQRMADGEKVFPHMFGTDKLGRDIMVRTMYGTRVSMIIGLAAAFIVLVIGALYGSISGYCGGKVDAVMQRIVDVIYSVPEVLVILLISTSLQPHITQFITDHQGNGLAESMRTLGPNLIAMFISFGLLYWVSMSRIIRGQILQLKQQEYVTAARALGASGGRIIRRHLLPNCIGQIVVTTCLQIPSAIFLESFMSYLGVGVSAPLTSLGSMCRDALSGFTSYTYRLVIPAAIISVMILAFNLFGDGLRDALDPRLKK